MIYTEFNNISLSLMGLGSAGVPLVKGINSIQKWKTNTFDIFDIELEKNIINYLFDNGVNYVELSDAYHNGLSQILISYLLKSRKRESYYVANKCGRAKNSDEFIKIVNNQLELCELEYFDFYLLHGVTPSSLSRDERCIEALIQLKKSGKIRYIGFSEHMDINSFEYWVNKYGNIFDFAQIQLNWVDWTFLNIQKKLEILKKFNLPVWVMCPLKNNQTADIINNKISLEERHRLDSFRKWSSPNEWTFKFLQSIPEVKVVLCGPQNMSHCYQNIEIFSNRDALSVEEFNYLSSLGYKYTDMDSFGCINCGYCLKSCPKEIDIPGIILNDIRDLTCYRFSLEKEIAFVRKRSRLLNSLNCINCKQCEQKCTQSVPVTEIFNAIKKFCKENLI